MKNKYKESLPLMDALALWMESLRGEGIGPPRSEEHMPAHDALGRVTSRPVFALASSPGWHSAAMDGYAVRASATFGASETNPKRLRIGSEAVPIDTGKPMPMGFDAVMMHEDVSVEDGHIEFTASLPPWRNVRTAGEDIVATELIVPENHLLRPMDIAAVISGGRTEISVWKRPVVAVIPTGSDLIEPPADGKVPKGLIIESNSWLLAGLVQHWGGIPVRNAIVPDEPEAITKAILDAARSQADVIALNAGASLGERDFTYECVEKAGRVILHGVSIRPGKPVILGVVGGKAVIGTPGFPVAAYMAFTLFAKPLIYCLQGLQPPPEETIEGRLSRTLPSTIGQEEFIRVKVGRVGEKHIVTPLSRGAGQLMSLVRADGLVNVPSMSEGMGPESPVGVSLLRGRAEIDNTVVFIGSHDSAIDILSSLIKRKHPAMSLSSAHVGSMGGLIAIKKGEAHCAPTHLLDEESGQYNIPFIKRLLPERPVTLINLVYRQQGLMVLEGNPKKILGFEDLARTGVRFVNRQGGSGTRLLLDKHLRELGIPPSKIYGYEKEEYTHMAVASAVLSGMADAGLGVLSASRALGLDFIPVARERYDILIPNEFLGLPMIKALLEIIREDGELRKALERMGGYGFEDMGKVMYET